MAASQPAGGGAPGTTRGDFAVVKIGTCLPACLPAGCCVLQLGYQHECAGRRAAGQGTIRSHLHWLGFPRHCLTLGAVNPGCRWAATLCTAATPLRMASARRVRAGRPGCFRSFQLLHLQLQAAAPAAAAAAASGRRVACPLPSCSLPVFLPLAAHPAAPLHTPIHLPLQPCGLTRTRWWLGSRPTSPGSSSRRLLPSWHQLSASSAPSQRQLAPPPHPHGGGSGQPARMPIPVTTYRTCSTA